MSSSIHGVQVRTAALPGGPIRYLEAGEGPPLVLLHGGGLDSARLSWGHLIPRFARYFHVYAPDWPGYGGSVWSERRRTTRDLIDCLGQLIDHWPVAGVCLAGISMGGGVALGFTLARPERVSRLVLTGSYGLQSRAPSHRLGYLFVHLPGLVPFSWALLRRSRTLTRLSLQSIMAQPSAVTAELVDECYAALQDRGAGRAFLAWQRSELRWGGVRTCYADRLGEMEPPVLLIHGAADPLVPLAVARRAAHDIAHATLRVYPETGHWPQREQPARFAQEVIEFARAARPHGHPGGSPGTLP